VRVRLMPESSIYDVTVIGGGPAGTSTAITAARSGARVLLLEAGKFPRHKVCGEFVSPESLKLLETLLDSNGLDLLRDATKISSARIFVDGRVVKTEIAPAAASIARIDLDQALWSSAERSGMDVKQQVKVTGIDGSGPFAVRSSVGTFETRAVVNAAGRWSNLRRLSADTGNGRPKWIGLKAHFEENEPSPSVDLYFFNGGYCGVQPVGESRVNACAMVRADVASKLEEIVQLHPELEQRALQWRELMDPISVAPLVFEEPQPIRNGIFNVGDAAGFVDPFVGDGISLALQSGALAARCLCENKFSIVEASGMYRSSYERQLAPVFRSSSRIRRMLALPGAVRKPIVALISTLPTITEYLVKKTRIA